MSDSLSANLDPTKILEFKKLEREAKALAAEGKLLESLQKFELARNIYETPKLLDRIQRLKDHMEKVLSPKLNNVSAVRFQSDTTDEKIDFPVPSSLEQISANKSCPAAAFQKPKILNDIQNVQKPAHGGKKVVNHPSELSPGSLRKFKELKKEGMDFSYDGKLEKAIEKFQEALQLCDCPTVKSYIHGTQDIMSKREKDIEKFQDLARKGEMLLKKGHPEESLKQFKEAYAVLPSPKISKMIKTLQAHHNSDKIKESLGMKSGKDDGREIEKIADSSKSVAYSNSDEIHQSPGKTNFTQIQDDNRPKLSDNQDCEQLDTSLTTSKKEEFSSLYRQARKLSHEGHLREALELLNKAKSIYETDKILQRISELKNLMKNDEETSEDDNKMIEVAKGFFLFHDIYNKLYPYQREGVAWMWSLYEKNKGGVLGDDMGLGKTFQVIAFLSGMIDATLIKYILIVMPVSLLPVWENEFKKWCPGITVQCFHGKTKKENERSALRIQRRGHVLLTSYGMVVNNVETLTELDGKRFIWDYLILDEGHKIKNPTKTTKAVHDIPSKHRLVLTGTPVQNNLRELWSLYDFTHQGTLLGSSKTFKMQYENIITRSREKDATVGEKHLGTKMAESLKNLIKPYFLRRTKDEIWKNKNESTDIKDLEEEIGNLEISNKLNSRKNDLIVWLYMSDLQIDLYRSFLHSEAVQNILCSKRSPLVELTVLKKICDHPRLLSQRACYELGLNGDLRHEDLLQELDEEAASAPSIENVSDESLMNESGKLKFLITLLENLREAGHRTLVFSLSRKVLDMIHRILLNRKWKFLRIDGTVSKIQERERRIQLFQHDFSYSVFLLTTQVGGVGITLTSADRVVIYDPSWNPATDSQAVDRVYRIGQKKDVVIYRFITCGSVEEKIYRRQVFKDSITRQATCTSDPYRYFSKQELRELFSLENPRYSATQVQLSEMHSSQRKTDVHLDQHIAFLYSLNIFGISDHDLMFTKHFKDHTEDNDELCISKDYIKKVVATAQQSIQAEASIIEEGLKLSGCYARPYMENIPSFKKSLIKDVYKPPMLPEVIDISEENEHSSKSISIVPSSESNDENLEVQILNFSLNSGREESSVKSDIPNQKLKKITDYFSGGDDLITNKSSKSNSEESFVSDDIIVEDTNEQKAYSEKNHSIISDNKFQETSIAESFDDDEKNIGGNTEVSCNAVLNDSLVKKSETFAGVNQDLVNISRISKTVDKSMKCEASGRNFETDDQRFCEKAEIQSESDSDMSSLCLSSQNSPISFTPLIQKSKLLTSSPMKLDIPNVTKMLNTSLNGPISDESPVGCKKTRRRSCARPALIASDSDTSQQASCPSSANTTHDKIVEETDESDCKIENDSFDNVSFHNSPSSVTYVPSSIPNSPVSLPVKISRQINLLKSSSKQKKLGNSLNFELQSEKLKGMKKENLNSVSLIEKKHDDSIRRITPLKIDRSYMRPNSPFEKALAASPILCLKSPIKNINADSLSVTTQSENDDSPVKVKESASLESEDDDDELPKSFKKRQVKHISSSESENSGDDSEVFHDTSNPFSSSLKNISSEMEKSNVEAYDQTVDVSDVVFNSTYSSKHSSYSSSSETSHEETVESDMSRSYID